MGRNARPWRILRSDKGGLSWARLNVGLSDAVVALAIDPAQPTTLYAGMGVGVSKSLDRGESWASSANPRLPVSAIAIDPQNTSTVYLGTRLGVFKSMDAARAGHEWLCQRPGSRS